MKTSLRITTRATGNSGGEKHSLTYRRNERLRSRKSISELFLYGERLNCGPVRVFYRVTEESAGILMGVSVPKRIFKRAVDRNLLKRRIREAYRLRKKDLVTRLGPRCDGLEIMIQYRHREIKDFHNIDSAIERGLDGMCEKLESPNE